MPSTTAGAEERILPLAADRGMAVLTNLPFGRGRVFKAFGKRADPRLGDRIRHRDLGAVRAQVRGLASVCHGRRSRARRGREYLTDNLGAARPPHARRQDAPADGRPDRRRLRAIHDMTSWPAGSSSAPPTFARASFGALLLSCAYFFLILTAYYILRPIRDEMGLAGRRREPGVAVHRHADRHAAAASALHVAGRRGCRGGASSPGPIASSSSTSSASSFCSACPIPSRASGSGVSSSSG